MSLLEDDWGFPVVDGDMDPNDPLVNSASEYMYQMATIAYHTLNGTQNIVLTAGRHRRTPIASEQLDADGTYNGVVEAYQGQVLEPGSYEVPVNGRYWTGFDRMDLLDGQARDLALERHGPRTGRRTRCGCGDAQHPAARPRCRCTARRPRRGVHRVGCRFHLGHQEEDEGRRSGHDPRCDARRLPGYVADRVIDTQGL